MGTLTISDKTEKCRENLERILSDYGNAAIAFSGGLDSTLLVESATHISKLRFIAITVRSVFTTEDEIAASAEFLSGRNVKHVILDADVLSVKKIAENHADRCYHCKKFIFSMIMDKASENGFYHVVDGTHNDDLDDYRPGLVALSELGIKSPLKESGFAKDNIRELARYYGLNNWDSNTAPCLATRIPYGTEIRERDTRIIARGEKILMESGFDKTRLRVHGNIARIEVPEEHIHILADGSLRKKIIEQIKLLGFDYITLDLEGYRTGSMNINIKKDKIIGN